MRKEKALIVLLRALVDLLAEESARNPEFGNRVETILSNIASPTNTPARRNVRPLTQSLPDIYKEMNDRGDAEFRLWLRDQPIPVLRGIIREQDLDPSRRSAKWNEPEKLAQLIADALSARASRGSAFIGRRLVD